MLHEGNSRRINYEAVSNHFSSVVEKYHVSVTLPYVSVASVRRAPETVKDISEDERGFANCD